MGRNPRFTIVHDVGIAYVCLNEVFGIRECIATEFWVRRFNLECSRCGHKIRPGEKFWSYGVPTKYYCSRCY